MPSPSYLIACIAVPVIWGLVVAYVYDRLAQREKRSAPKAEPRDIFTDFEI